MNYQEMIEDLRRAGHDVQHFVKHSPSLADEDLLVSKSNLTIGQVAEIILEEIHKRVDPLERRVAELEAQTRAKSVVLPPGKPRVQAGRWPTTRIAHDGRPVVRVPARSVAT